MSTPDPCPTGLMERFGDFITRLKKAMVDGIDRRRANHTLGPIAVILWGYLSRTLDRLTRLHAKFTAGTLAPPRLRKAPAECGAPEGRPQKRPEKPPLPSGPVFLEFHAAHLHHVMRQLFADPEMVALIQAAPQAGRILRPLWRRMTADPLPEILRLPKRKRRSRRQSAPAEPEAKPAQAAPAAPLRPRSAKPPRPRRRAVPAEEPAIWVWHPPPLKRV